MRLGLLMILAGCAAHKPAPEPIDDSDASLHVGLSDGGGDGGGTVMSVAVAYQIGAEHAGHQTDPALTPPLTQKWSTDLTAPVSYPLIADGKIFVIARSQLQALAPASGESVWTAKLPTAWGALAWDRGVVFSVDDSGQVAAWDDASGRQLWRRLVSGAAPPVAAGGVVFVVGGGVLYAIGGLDGAQQWAVHVDGGGQGAPAIGEGGVFAVGGCNAAMRLAPNNGFQAWHHSVACPNGAGGTPALSAGRLFARDPSVLNVELDIMTGSVADNFVATPIPAFDGATGYFLSAGRLQGIDPRTNKIAFTFTGDGQLNSAPLSVNDAVYIGSRTGMVFAVDRMSGRQLWSANAGAPIVAPDEPDHSQPLTGFAAGNGLLLVPAGNFLVAYE